MEENVGMFDALIRFGAVALLTVGAYWLTRLLLARFALPLLRRSQPKWAAAVERSRLPMLTALLAAVITLGLAASVLTDSYPQINNVVRILDVAVGIGVLPSCWRQALRSPSPSTSKCRWRKMCRCAALHSWCRAAST
jgi:hypothetical protein